MLRAKELGAEINLHAENPDLIDMRTEQFLKEGKTSAWYHYLSRPEFVEAEADKRAVHWATHLDAPLYIVHMADKEGLEECIKAKQRDTNSTLKPVRSTLNLPVMSISVRTAETLYAHRL